MLLHNKFSETVGNYALKKNVFRSLPGSLPAEACAAGGISSHNYTGIIVEFLLSNKNEPEHFESFLLAYRHHIKSP